MSTKVLVTGASGVVGQATAKDLASHGYYVATVDSSVADLRDRNAALNLFQEMRPDCVVHLAARVHGIMGNSGRQGDMFVDNILINTNVIEAARQVGVRKFVGMGSTAMYSDEASRPMSEHELLVGQPHHSEAGYSLAKRTMLTQLELYREQFGMDFAVCVATNMYGPHDRFDEQNGHVLPSLISKFERAVRTNEPVQVWGTGRATRDFLYCADAAAGIRAVLENGDGVVNLASGEAITIRETVEVLADVAGLETEIEWDTSKPDGQMDRSYDISRLKDLGWSPSYSLDDGLRATFSWYRENMKLVRR